MMEFHVSRQSRDRYKFDQAIFTYNGNAIFANFHAARMFAQKMNEKRDLVSYPEQAVKAGQINALGLIDEILHHVFALYRRQKNPQVINQALDYLSEAIGKDALDRTLLNFTTEFPPVVVYKRELTPEEFLAGETDGVSHRAVALEEMVLLWVTNKNPAALTFSELFDDEGLSQQTSYSRLMVEIYKFFDNQPPFGPDRQNLIDVLRAPALKNPYSLEDQLDYIRSVWGEMLGRFLYRLLSSLDLIKEESKMAFGPGGPGPIAIPIYTGSAAAGGLEGEPERFSQDREWMPRLVLMAKNSFVWLNQLSEKYQRPINHLDQIPDQELDELARWGITGLWLIGLWERSEASARIKQLCGNPEAISSAYSLSDYSIARDLGGDAAYQNLRDRAWSRGIRLASDMVPNHMGIDSSWVLYHPERFISLDYSPFPSYSFNGPDLSPDPNIGIFLEDHYYDRTDAAVVFKRVDRRNGSVKYLYHGNDGTSMPWNDTAQLNYLNPEVRETVIQTILEVARKFPIIRFDAAMTLAKKHYQRLWFPEPGSGGDIPSRAEHALTRDAFNNAMPVEFWREVVDRAAVEAPDTLLLAEAFWLMEGYFVRTLGMHRVYNSAFMNLLRNEENAKYRTVMKTTLEFDPEILKRYVNFMNNPDERTAVDQFGKGDKYFGICVLLATLPGLPMFGHGQVEGYAEKYGMEFRRAYWNEKPDPYLIERHQREIFPILHKRYLFAGVENFLLYDFYTPNGTVDENVFAFSNGYGSERALVVYHNRFGDTYGSIRTSVGFVQKTGGDHKQNVQRTLSQGLNLRGGENSFLIYRDVTKNLEYIRSSREIVEKGLLIDLEAYEYHVFIDMREVEDDAWRSYRQLCSYLNGRGVPNIEEALRELVLLPVLTPYREIANPGYFDYLLNSRCNTDKPLVGEPLLREAREKIGALLDGISYLNGGSWQRETVLTAMVTSLKSVLSLPCIEKHYPMPGAAKYLASLDELRAGLDEIPHAWLTLFGWVSVAQLGKMEDKVGFEYRSQSWMNEWQLSRNLLNVYTQMGISQPEAESMVGNIHLLVGQQTWYSKMSDLPINQIMQKWLSDDTVQRYLGINRYNEVLWFNQEAMQKFIQWMNLLAVLEISTNNSLTASAWVERVLGAHEITCAIAEAAVNSDFQVAKLLTELEVQDSSSAAPAADAD